MVRMNPLIAIGLCASAAAAAFGIGWYSAQPLANPPPEDLAASIRAALAEGDVLDRSEHTTRLLQHLGPESVPTVRAVYDQMLPLLGEWEIRPFVAAWARFDPAGALEHALAWPIRMKRDIAVEAAIEGWALRDPSAARGAVERVASERRGVREQLLLGVLAGWVHSRRDGLDSYLAELPTGSQDAATAVVVGALMRSGGPDATLRWVDPVLRDESQDAALKRSLFRRATRSVSRVDPERGAAWALEHAGNAYADDGPRIVAEQWGAVDGRAALEWVREHADGELRPPAVREAFVQWLGEDPEGARAWLLSETLTEFHDPALAVYARRVDDQTPQEAIGWCERVRDVERRRRCFRVVAIQWYRRDPDAAETWLQQSPLDEEARSAVRASGERKQLKAGARSRARRGPR